MKFSTTLATIAVFFCVKNAVPAQSSCQLISTKIIHECIDTTFGVQYAVGRRDWGQPDPQAGCTSLLPLFTDIFAPCEKTMKPRPLVIFIHGGAFLNGDKKDFWPYADSIARRGFITASISYRLSLDPLDFSEKNLIRAGYRASQDVRAAVRYFKANAPVYGVDTSNIFLAGASAGAVAVLDAAFARNRLDKPEEAGLLSSCGTVQGCPRCPDLGSPEGEGGNSGFSSSVKGVIALAGAITDPTILDETDDTPVLMIHGTEDEVVPFGEGCFLDATPCLLLFGSGAIHEMAENRKLCISLSAVEGGGHEATADARRILSEAAYFLHALVCQGSPCLKSVVDVEKRLVIRNPVGNRIQVRLPATTAAGDLVLSDAFGRILHRREVGPGTLDLEIEAGNLHSGIYFLSWREAGAGRPLVMKLIKQR